MQWSKIVALLTSTVLLLSLLNIQVTNAANIEIDLNGTVSNAIDGDTFYVTAKNGTQYRVRLADVDAPERDEIGYTEAKEYLNSLIYEKTVYLDVDDIYTWDNYGAGNRIVCITYVYYNSTHYLNTNEALFEAGKVEKKEYANEFNPYTWDLYISKQENPEFPTTTLFVATVIIVLIIIFLQRRRRWSQTRFL